MVKSQQTVRTASGTLTTVHGPMHATLNIHVRAMEMTYPTLHRKPTTGQPCNANYCFARPAQRTVVLTVNASAGSAKTLLPVLVFSNQLMSWSAKIVLSPGSNAYTIDVFRLLMTLSLTVFRDWTASEKMEKNVSSTPGRN
jgi:hypothetical protein